LASDTADIRGVSGFALKLDRHNQKRADGLSASLQIAKAAEHLACADLLIQGWNAFLSDQGLPYDILVDRGSGRFCRVQVKGTCGPMSPRVTTRKVMVQPLYRFSLNTRQRSGESRLPITLCDYLALVALDIKLVAWIPTSAVILPNGKPLTLVEMKSRSIEYRRTGPTGIDPATCGRFLEDYTHFDPDGEPPWLPRCIPKERPRSC